MILCLIVSSTLLFFLSPPLQPRRWKGEVSSDVPSLLVVYHNSGSGIISIDKEQRKKKRRNEKQPTFLLFDSHFGSYSVSPRPSLHPFCPAEINWRKRRKFSRCMTFPSLLDARHSIYPITKDASMLLVEKGYCSLNIHLARWDDIFFFSIKSEMKVCRSRVWWTRGWRGQLFHGLMSIPLL